MTAAKLSTIFYSGQVDGICLHYFPTSPISIFIIPRAQIYEAKKLKNINNPGIYFLISQTEDKKIKQIYIGMTRNGISRLRDHSRKKFWNVAIMFLADEKNFTLDIIGELEKYAIEKIIHAYNFEVKNAVLPKSEIKEYDLSAIEQFYSEIKFLMESIGYFPKQANNG